jgi:hypothetical protein
MLELSLYKSRYIDENTALIPIEISLILVYSEKKYCDSLNITSKLSIMKVENSFDIEIAF